MSVIEVKDLKISFWTNNGTVKAVRNISFNVDKGQTLAIVGESGSGKSVTAKALLGILAGNAIVEGGEIFYDGKDLLRVPEEVFHHIRGNNIAMIFQDPLSSLNPIMRVGKQLTEAMIANNQAARKQSKQNYSTVFKSLKQNMIDCGIDSSKANDMMSRFSKFIAEGNKLETEYNISHDRLETAVSNIERAKIELISATPKDIAPEIAQIVNYAKGGSNEFLVSGQNYEELISEVANAKASFVSEKGSQPSRDKLVAELNKLSEVIKKALGRNKPDFIAIGYYSLKNGRSSLQGKEIIALNEEATNFMKKDFLDEFRQMVEKAAKYSNEKAVQAREQAVKVLSNSMNTLSGAFTPAQAKEVASNTNQLVVSSINLLDINKDSIAYTYGSAMDNAVRIFTLASKSEGMSDRRKTKARKKSKLPVELDLEDLRENIRLIVRRAKESFDKQLDQKDKDYKIVSEQIITYLDNESSKMNYKISKSLAKSRAIDLMAEVGIPQPRLRYRQYPFEFSGGMRQRIVIAIALASNPDVLICDEPTTALDVTIQAQILDLINELKRERQLSIIFITHDLGVVANMADTIAVMYAGKIVEYGSSDEVFYQAAHPYTWALLASMPDLDTKEKLEFIPGVPPNMIYPPKGDAFAQRNKYALAIDFEEQPPMFEITPTHFAATWLLHPDAPKVEKPQIITDRIKRMNEKWGGIISEQ